MMTITTAQISALRTEAASHGDMKQVKVCDRALDGSKAAIRKCAAVIAAARYDETAHYRCEC